MARKQAKSEGAQQGAAQQPPGDLASVLASQKKLATPFDATKLPALVPKAAGGAIDVDAVLSGLKREVGKGAAFGLVPALEAAVTPESLDAFAVALCQQWQAAGSPSPEKWAFETLGPLGGDGAAEFLGAQLQELSHQRAVQALELLRQIGTDLAVHAIADLALTPTRFWPRRHEAEAVLEKRAGRASDVEDLLDRTLPRVAEGALRARVERVQALRLDALVVDGRRIAAPLFKERFVAHPVMGPLVRTLVWVAVGMDDKPEKSFRVAEDGTLLDAAGAPVELLEGWKIGLAHPLELGIAALAPWREAFAALKLKQCVPQLDRPTYALEEAEKATKSLTRFAKRRVGFHAINDTLTDRGWEPYDINDGGGIDSWVKTFSRDRARIEAKTEDGSGALLSIEAKVEWGKLGAIVVSEALMDLERAVGGARAARPEPAAPGAAPAKPGAKAGGLPQTGKYPFSELAKSGRSKCVICGQAIEKGARRIGVERMIETPAFTGRGTAWLHDGCKDNCPELAGIADLEAVLAKNSPKE